MYNSKIRNMPWRKDLDWEEGGHGRLFIIGDFYVRFEE